MLVVLITTFLRSPFFKAGIGSILSALLLLYTIILIIRSFALPKLLMSVYTGIAVIAFVLRLSASLDWIPEFNQPFGLFAKLFLPSIWAVLSIGLGETSFQFLKSRWTRYGVTSVSIC
ncbi:MAG: hypothetical protein AAFY67_14720 [Cyanobacteria bacterium J06642_9]